MKCPRKTELQRLQAQYKTDARIAEVLQVPEYLVGYWRRKKGLPRYSAPKFAKEQITELWARFGDDFRCGRELNISKAAFYSWRRKYDILERPAVLKLEQLELRLGGAPASTSLPTVSHPRTGSHKILDRAASDWPNNSVPLDWWLKAADEASSEQYILSPGPDFQPPRTKFAPEPLPMADIRQSIWLSEEFGDIEWQLVESRVVHPGQFLGLSGAGCAGLGGVGLLTLSEKHLGDEPQRVLKVEVTRRLPQRVEVEDLVFALIERGVHEDWQDAIVELLGAPIERLSVDRKVKLTSLIVHYGAVAALCPFDDAIRRHFGRQLKGRFPQSHPDRTAIYDGEHFIEGRGVEPVHAPLVRSTNPTLEPVEGGAPGGVIIGPAALPYEIEQAAATVRGRRIAAHQALLVCPATPGVQRLAQRRGWSETIFAAGGSVLDIALVRRMGTHELLELAVGKLERVYCTRPPRDGSAANQPDIRLTSARSACEQLQFLF